MLADWFFHEQGIREKVELIYATPLPGAFTKPIAAKHLGDILEQKGVEVIPEFMIERVDADAKKIVHYDESEVEYDLLVTVPLNMGDELIARSGLGDELNYVPVDKHTFLSNAHENVFALGDAAAALCADIEGRLCGPLRRRLLLRELPALHRRPRDDAHVRWPRQLLHRIRLR